MLWYVLSLSESTWLQTAHRCMLYVPEKPLCGGNNKICKVCMFLKPDFLDCITCLSQDWSMNTRYEVSDEPLLSIFFLPLCNHRLCRNSKTWDTITDFSRHRHSHLHHYHLLMQLLFFTIIDSGDTSSNFWVLRLIGHRYLISAFQMKSLWHYWKIQKNTINLSILPALWCFFFRLHVRYAIYNNSDFLIIKLY